jgi:site-specific DNA-methyltransferase (adenine-specific)
MDVSKAIDKQAGAEREIIGRNPNSREQATKENTLYESGTVGKTAFDTAPSTPEAQQWQGWGTALKPAFEPVIVARKPIEGTVANNVLKWGTGGLNIDGSRISANGDNLEGGKRGGTDNEIYSKGLGDSSGKSSALDGRWPANIILDPYTAELVDEQSGDRPGGNFPTQRGAGVATGFGLGKPTEGGARKMNDSGGASRFFYVAKASKRDRNEGLDDLEAKTASEMTGRKEGSAGLVMKHEDGSDKANAYAGTTGAARQNFHPTVKPTSLMEYLVKLVTPPGGVVLDPFTGSGSTGKAAILQGFDFIGIELTQEYLPIIQGRLKYAEQLVAEAEEQEKLKETEKLF